MRKNDTWGVDAPRIEGSQTKIGVRAAARPGVDAPRIEGSQTERPTAVTFHEGWTPPELRVAKPYPPYLA